MDKGIGIGLIVGLVVAVVSFIYRNNSFTPTQRLYLTISFVFPPLGLILTLITYLYNRSNLQSETQSAEDLTPSNPPTQPLEPTKHTEADQTKKRKGRAKTVNDLYNNPSIHDNVRGVKISTGLEKDNDPKLQDLSIEKLLDRIERIKESVRDGILEKKFGEAKINEIYTVVGQKQEEIILSEQKAFEEELRAQLLKENKAKIDKLKQFLFDGVISQQEFNTQKEAILKKAREEYFERK